MNNDTLLKFRELIKSMANLSNNQIDELANASTQISFKKNEYFSTIEKPSMNIAYVAIGLFRLYLIGRDGTEVTLAFTGENMFMSSYSAIVLDKLQHVYIQALENSEIHSIERVEFLRIMDSDSKWKDLLQKATELDCLRTRKRESDFLLYDAKTRYLRFLKDFPNYAKRIKQRYIASYLGISPETLSRILKTI